MSDTTPDAAAKAMCEKGVFIPAFGVYMPRHISQFMKQQAEEIDSLRTRLAEANQAHRNTLHRVEEILSPEWNEARTEVFKDGNQGWLMVVDVTVHDLRTRLAEAEKLLEQEEKSCPCCWTTPCKTTCTCANGFMSGGCLRCCRYGSIDQQKQMAEYIVARETRLAAAESDNQRMRAVVEAALRQSGCDGDLCLYQWHEDARALLSRPAAGTEERT